MLRERKSMLIGTETSSKSSSPSSDKEKQQQEQQQHHCLCRDASGRPRRVVGESLITIKRKPLSKKNKSALAGKTAQQKDYGEKVNATRSSKQGRNSKQSPKASSSSTTTTTKAKMSPSLSRWKWWQGSGMKQRQQSLVCSSC